MKPIPKCTKTHKPEVKKIGNRRVKNTKKAKKQHKDTNSGIYLYSYGLIRYL